MWESVLKNGQIEIQMNQEQKHVRFQVTGRQDSGDKESVVLTQTELFELLHTFLTINRSFNQETMYYDDPQIAG